MSNIRRSMMAASRGGGSAIDWETIGHGMIDYTTPFSVPAGILPTFADVGDKSYAFISRANLISVNFEGQSYIPERICQGCTSLTSLTFSSNLVRIGNYAFYNCTSLQEVIVQKDTPPTLGSTSLGNCHSLAAIYVPDASVDAYKAANGWSTYANIIKGISERPTT